MTTTTAATTEQKVKLASSDGQEFTVKLSVANMSITLKNMLEDIPESESAVPLPNVTGKILEKVIVFCQYHIDHPSAESEKKDERARIDEPIQPWDQTFCKVEISVLFELILAANYLDIKSLLDVTCKTVANMIKGKTPEEIRTAFNIKNDFTPYVHHLTFTFTCTFTFLNQSFTYQPHPHFREEEEIVRKENEWCEDK